MPTAHFPDLSKIALHHLTIQKHDGIQRLVLGSSCHLFIYGQMGNNSLISCSPISAGCRHPHLFSPDAIVFDADYIPDLIE
jgi:hypothetical protein